MNNNNYASEILEENSEQNQKELNSDKSNDSRKNNNNIFNNKIDFSINENPDYKGNNSSSSSSSYLKENINNNIFFSLPNLKKPNLIRLSNKIFNEFSLLKPILNYLTIFELNNMRRINHNILSLVNDYFKIRIKIEINYITDYQEKNKDKVHYFINNIDTQIPLSNKNWLDFDLNSIVNKINILNRNIINRLKYIKNLNKISDVVFAPFCIIFSKNNNELLKNLSWLKILNKILFDYNIFYKIQNLDIENLKDDNILEAFKYLNKPELEINNIKKYSTDIAKLVIWCQGVVSYHIIIHPYIYRNKNNNLIEPGSDIYNFILEIENMIEKFYKFKRFLYILNIMKIPIADYVFNLQYNININNRIELNNSYYNINNKIYFIDKIDISILSNIFSYIPFNKSYKLINVCKKFYEGFKSSIDVIIFEMIKEIYFFRYQSYKKLINEIPLIFSYNFFSKFFLMIDDILNSNCKNNNEFGNSFYPFLSNEHLNNIKLIKINNDLVEHISKIFCFICDLKPKKELNKKTLKVEFNYFDIIKALAVKGKLNKLMRNYNKLFFNREKIAKIFREIKIYLNNEKLNQIKKINKGICQLLIWELYILLYLKLYNIFDFMNIDNFRNTYNNQELEKIHYYIELMNYLKYYLKIKFHFSGGNKLNNNNNKNFELFKYITKLISFLGEKKLSNGSNIIFESTNSHWEKIGNAYFESKDSIPFNAKPIFYERIMIEILNLNEKKESYSFYSISSDSEIFINDKKFNLNYSNNLYSPIEGYKSKKNNNNININIKNNIFKNRINENLYYNSPKNRMIRDKININQKKKIDEIPEDIFIKYIFFYLEINYLPIISLINHKFLSMIKTHFNIRIYIVKTEKKNLENEKKEIFNSIKAKRLYFYKQYEINEPSKEHAFQLINQINEKDLSELKQYFKMYNKNYEKLIIPFLIILENKNINNIDLNGEKQFYFYTIAKRILFKPDFIKKIKNIELELIPNKVFEKIEKIMKEDIFSEKRVKNICTCFKKLINWVLGIIEFHRAVRKYSLSCYDYEILNKEEIEFCKKMDNIILFYYKLNRYNIKYCQQYENRAKIIMKEMGIIN